MATGDSSVTSLASVVPLRTGVDQSGGFRPIRVPEVHSRTRFHSLIRLLPQYSNLYRNQILRSGATRGFIIRLLYPLNVRHGGGLEWQYENYQSSSLILAVRMNRECKLRVARHWGWNVLCHSCTRGRFTKQQTSTLRRSAICTMKLPDKLLQKCLVNEGTWLGLAVSPLGALKK